MTGTLRYQKTTFLDLNWRYSRLWWHVHRVRHSLITRRPFNIYRLMKSPTAAYYCHSTVSHRSHIYYTNLSMYIVYYKYISCQNWISALKKKNHNAVKIIILTMCTIDGQYKFIEIVWQLNIWKIKLSSSYN